MPVFAHPSEYQKGQVLLIIVLVMIVALTIGLSVVTRSVTNLQISKEEENSQRALSAAEAGIERALQNNSSAKDISLGNNASIKDVQVTPVNGDSFLVNNGNPILQDDGADIWLSTVTTNPDSSKTYTEQFPQNPSEGDLRILWGSSNESCDGSSMPAAIEILVITNPGGVPQIKHYPIDPCSGTQNRVATNNFCTVGTANGCPTTSEYANETDPASLVDGKHFRYGTTITGIQNGIMARVVPLYSSTVLGVSAQTSLPLQGTIIESTGASGGTQRKVSVYKGFAKVPIEFFPYILFSPQ